MSVTVSEEIMVALPSLKQKFLVDLVNGIDVSRDQIKVQKGRGGFTNRLWDSIIGDAHRHQTQINEQVVNGLNSCFEWLGEMTEELTFTNTALVQISDGLSRVKSDLTNFAHFSADTREQFVNFQLTVDSRMAELEATIRQVDMRQRAHQQMDSLFASWEAGNYAELSLAQRCFLILSELAWGVFTDYCRIAPSIDQEQILKDLRNRLIIHIKRDAGLNWHDRVDSKVWLNREQVPAGLRQEYYQALCFLGDRLSQEQYGFNWYVLNVGLARPAKIPYIMSAPRLIDGMTQELIKDGQLHVG